MSTAFMLEGQERDEENVIWQQHVRISVYFKK